jgi:hypothetical protein
MIYIRYVPSSDLGPEASWTDKILFYFSSVSQGECWTSALNWIRFFFLPHSLQVSFRNCPTIRPTFIHLRGRSQTTQEPYINIFHMHIYIQPQNRNRGSSVSVVTRLRSGRPGFDSRQVTIFFSSSPVRTESDAHLASYVMGTRSSSAG